MSFWSAASDIDFPFALLSIPVCQTVQASFWLCLYNVILYIELFKASDLVVAIQTLFEASTAKEIPMLELVIVVIVPELTKELALFLLPITTKTIGAWPVTVSW